MQEIKAHNVAGVRAAGEAKDLHRYLQSAIELEHATIPTYLYALYSIKPESNVEISQIIRSVVVEEMLHMTLAANVMNALGGEPLIDDPEFVPSFPGKLPMSVDDGLEVHLRPLSIHQVQDTFMAIEEPEAPLDFPADAIAEGPGFATIGLFYAEIIKKIRELGDAAFVGDPARQVVPEMWFRGEIHPVTNVETAVQALTLIVEQGEGLPGSPLDPSCDLAHYYRFEEIVKGRRLVPIDEPPHYAFTGDPVPFDPKGVYGFVEDPSNQNFDAGSRGAVWRKRANVSYSNLLRRLHRVFNGHPKEIDRAMGLMFELRLLVNQMAEFSVNAKGEDDRNGVPISPSFEYVPEAASDRS